MRLFDGVGCTSRRGLLSLWSSPGATILELFDARSTHTYSFLPLSLHVHLYNVGMYKRAPETTNYNASASGASGVSNEMQEVWARVVHRCGVQLRERESMMKAEWKYRARGGEKKKSEEKESDREN